jgi:pilus assembly protein CpaF
MGLADRLGKVVGGPAAGSTVESREYEARYGQFDRLKRAVHAKLVDRLGPRLYGGDIDKAELQEAVFDVLQDALEDEEERPLSAADRARVVQEIVDDILGLGPLEPLLRDPTVTEIMVNTFDEIFIERGGRINPTSLRFASERHLREIIDRIVSQVGRRVDESSPMVDARLADGSRVNAVVRPIAVNGTALTIRKFAKEPYTVRDLISMGTLTPASADFLRDAVVGRRNILISGGTGSGKTTTMNVLSSFIPHDERIITIEDAAELQLEQPHVVRLESRPPNIEGVGEISIRDLVRNSLRMRPDRIIVGEVRDAAALDMLQAMNTGHDGSLSTVHANSPRDALSRIETMVMMAGLDLPVSVIRDQIASAIDLVIHEARLRDGSRHIMEISEIVGVEGSIISMQTIFAFEHDHHPGPMPHGRLLATGIVPSCIEDLLDRGVDVDLSLFQAGRS